MDHQKQQALARRDELTLKENKPGPQGLVAREEPTFLV